MSISLINSLKRSKKKGSKMKEKLAKITEIDVKILQQLEKTDSRNCNNTISHRSVTVPQQSTVDNQLRS